MFKIADVVSLAISEFRQLNPFSTMDEFDSPPQRQIPLHCVGLFIGKYHDLQYNQEIQFSSNGMKIDISNQTGDCTIFLLKNKIVRTVFFFNEQKDGSNALFVSIASSCAHYVCDELQSLGIHCNLSPISRDSAENRIVIMFKMDDPSTRTLIESCYNQPFTRANLEKDKIPPIIEELYNSSVLEIIGHESANNLLITSIGYKLTKEKPTPAEVNNNCEDEASKHILTYPPNSRGSVSLINYDLRCLSDGEFLNDKIIYFYLQFINHEILTPEQQRSTHFLDTFFYQDLVRCLSADTETISETERWSKVEKYTKNVNIFEKDFIFVPINEVAHWYVAVICFPYLCEENSVQVIDTQIPCILRFNSMPRINDRVFADLRLYLNHEYKVKNSQSSADFSARNIIGRNVKVPEQQNYYDCGIFLLTYVEKFFTDPIDNFKSIKDKKDWFKVSETHTKRQKIAETIKRLVEVYTPGVAIDISCLKFPTPKGKRSRTSKRLNFSLNQNEESPAVSSSSSPPICATRKRGGNTTINYDTEDEDYDPMQE